MIIGLILYFIIVIVIYFVASNSESSHFFFVVIILFVFTWCSMLMLHQDQHAFSLLMPFYNLCPPSLALLFAILFGSIGFLALVKCLCAGFSGHSCVFPIVDCNVHNVWISHTSILVLFVFLFVCWAACWIQ